MKQQVQGQQGQPNIDDVGDTIQVLGAELSMDDLHVVNRIDSVLDMSDVWVLKRSQNVEDAVHGGDVGEESVAKALALCGSPTQAA